MFYFQCFVVLAHFKEIKTECATKKFINETIKKQKQKNAQTDVQTKLKQREK